MGKDMIKWMTFEGGEIIYLMRIIEDKYIT